MNKIAVSDLSVSLQKEIDRDDLLVAVKPYGRGHKSEYFSDRNSLDKFLDSHPDWSEVEFGM